MDITLNKQKLFANKIFNGETVNWGVCFFAVSLLFLFLKQGLKLFISLSAPVASGSSAVICTVVLFLLERKYVFNHNAKNSLSKQIIFYVFRCAVDFGFYKIASFVFVDVLKRSYALVYFLLFVILLFFNYYFDRLLVFDSRGKAENNKNGRLYKLFFNNRFIFASMLLATGGLAFVFFIFRLFPFGDTTVLRMDLYHQYGPLFCELYDRVINRQSFIYSWVSGGGSSFLGNYFNYLSSPLSAIIFLFDRKDMPYAITTLVAVKGILAAASFTFYLKESQKRHSFVSASFGVFYAFCAYFLAYYWNIMWIDGMILLPIILLGIERIINYNKPFCYIAGLTVLFWASYYMAYMVCLFSIFYFLAYFFMTKNPSDKVHKDIEINKKYSVKGILNNLFINRGLTFAGASLLCGALCAAVLIPVYFILQSTSATTDSFPTTFESYFDLLNLISSHLAALETTIRSSGDDVLPNIYCGILSMLLLPLYVANKKISIKEKVIYLLLVALLVFSFDNNCANFIWHAFHFPNDLPYRFSYIYSFIILVIAFRSLMHLKDIEYRDIAFSGMVWLLIILILQKYQTNKMSEFVIYINIALVLVWTVVLLLIKKENLTKFVLGVTVFAIAFCELIVADSNSYLFTQNGKDYVNNYDTYTEAIEKTYKDDESFYRTELSYLDTRMDPCLYGYRGMSTFSSMAYRDYSQTQYSMGMFGNRINSYTYNTQTPVYNMMYCLKYIMKTEDSIEPSLDFYTPVYTTSDDKTEVFKNDYFLPIAFETGINLSDWEVEEGNPFEVQSEFITYATGIEDIFVPVKYLSTEGVSVDIDDVTSEGTYFYIKDDPDNTSSTIDIDIETVNDSNLYVYITSPEIENVNYSWYSEDDEEEADTKYQNINEPYILDLGKHNKGETVTVSLECGSSEEESSYFEIYAYNIDRDKLISAYEMLSEGSLKIEKWNQTSFEGTLNAGYEGYLYTSIPYDDGWSIYIDGEKQENVITGNAQLSCLITEGEHSVKIKYSPKGLKYGIMISTATWLGLLLYLIYKKLGRNKKAETNSLNSDLSD